MQKSLCGETSEFNLSSLPDSLRCCPPYVEGYSISAIADIGLQRIESAMLGTEPKPGSFFAAMIFIAHFPRHKDTIVRQEVDALMRTCVDEISTLQCLQRFAPTKKFEIHRMNSITHADLRRCIRAHRPNSAFPQFCVSGCFDYFSKLLVHNCNICEGYPVRNGRVWFTYREVGAVLASFLSAFAERAITNAPTKFEVNTSGMYTSIASIVTSQQQLEMLQNLVEFDKTTRRKLHGGELAVDGTPRAHIDQYWPPCMREFGARGHPNNDERLKMFPLIYTVYGDNLPLWLALFPDDPQYEQIYKQNINRLDRIGGAPDCISMNRCGMCKYQDIEDCGREFARRFGKTPGPIRKPSEYILNALK